MTKYISRTKYYPWTHGCTRPETCLRPRTDLDTFSEEASDSGQFNLDEQTEAHRTDHERDGQADVREWDGGCSHT